MTINMYPAYETMNNGTHKVQQEEKLRKVQSSTCGEDLFAFQLPSPITDSTRLSTLFFPQGNYRGRRSVISPDLKAPVHLPSETPLTLQNILLLSSFHSGLMLVTRFGSKPGANDVH